MTKITILAIGKKHAPHLVEGLTYYENRLAPYVQLEWVLLPHAEIDVRHDGNIEQNRKTESQALISRLEKIKSKGAIVTILLDERGQTLTSPNFAHHLQNYLDHNLGQIIFIIGGAYGVASDLRQQVDQVWSFSQLIFPHQLMRLILLEQIYRAQMILTGKKYHHS